MKQSVFLIFVFLSASAQNQLFNNPDLGKTHFIVGLPPQENNVQEEVRIVPGTDLHARLICKDGSCMHAFFSPDDDLEELLIQLINAEQMAIQLAVFSFTDGAIAQALINARRRGVKIVVITDISGARDKFSKIDLLKKNGITVLVYDPRNQTVLNNIMHHKFVLFEKNVGGKSLVWTGSYNFTKSATRNNQENIVLLDSKPLIDKYAKQFSLLQERTRKLPVKYA